MPTPEPQRIAFVCPRFAGAGTVGGAEMLLWTLARSAAAGGQQVDFYATCAINHFTWANELPAGTRTVEGVRVHLFPVNANRDIDAFLRVQQPISSGRTVSDEEEDIWLRNSVNSDALIEALGQRLDAYRWILSGPYLFGLVEAVSRLAPSQVLLIPCLHDEPFAYLRRFAAMFDRVAGCIFNSTPERDLAREMYPCDFRVSAVVGMGVEPFEADRDAFAREHHIEAPYVIYSGRREPLKGTPLLLDYLDCFRRRTGRDVKLVLTGSGDIDPSDSLRPHIIDLGYVDEPTKQAAMAGAVAFCHPSVNESLSIVLLESWLAGTPGLVHAKGRVLCHQCRTAHGGLWFRDYADFEQALTWLLDHPDEARRLGDQGRSFVLREYAPAAIQRKLLDVLSSPSLPQPDLSALHGSV